MPDLASALGYNRDTFVTAADGTFSSYYYSNVNRSNVRARLVAYATNLANYIDRNNQTWSAVLGENLAVISYSWLAECSAEQQVMDQIVGSTTLYNFTIGITAQIGIQQTGVAGPYVDLPVDYLFTQQQSNPTWTATLD